MQNVFRHVLAMLIIVCMAGGVEADTTEWINQILSVQKRGEGNVQAAAAAAKLQEQGPEALLPVLNALDKANPLAFNWLQISFESIASRAQLNSKLPTQTLEKFVLEQSHNGRARKLAFDWLSRVDETAEKRLIPGMLNDPSGPLRREAVAAAILEAKQTEGEQAKLESWKKALSGAVDKDQVDEISDALKKLGEPVDLVKHFGLITEWYIVGPFDNTDMKAFNVAYPPEKEIDLDAEYEGKLGGVKWERFVSESKDGAFDIAELTEPHKGAIDYAFTEFNAEQTQEVEFRLATANAWKLWVNGELVFAREEYHRGMRFDQYIVRGEIRKGKNTFLLKVCQNEQTQDWAQKWAFQFRIVDHSGRAVTQAD